MKTKMTILLALATCATAFASNGSTPEADNDTLIVNNPSKVTVITGDSLQTIRIEGRNGFGKSTLVKLLLRLYDPAEGSVLLNGIDIRRFRLDDLRRRIGVLFQDFVRYNCSAAENITFGDIDHPDHSLRHAAALAGADSVIDHLPQGDATLLGRLFDQGAELSMGQWQRMAIARALQSDAPLLILDEPFAWLDADARRLLNQNLSELQKNKIIILITHS